MSAVSSKVVVAAPKYKLPAPTELQHTLRKSRSAFFTVGFFSMIINMLVLTSPVYMLQIYDRVLVSGSAETLLMLSLIALFLLLLLGLLEIVRSRVMVRVSIHLDEKLSGRIFEAIFASSLNKSASNQSQALRDLGSIRQFLTGPALFSFFDAPWTPFFIIVLFLIHPLIGTLSAIGATIIFILALSTEIVSRAPLREANKNAAQANEFTESSLRNAEILKALGMLSNIRQRWRQNHNEALSLQAKASDRVGMLLGMSKATRISLQVGVLGLGAYLALQDIISPGTMIAGSIIMGRALAPVEQAIGSWRNFIAARGAYQRLSMLLYSNPASAPSMPLPRPLGKLHVEKLFGAFPESKEFVIKDINFLLEPGESLGIIGPSAAGKSSLARLLMGIWAPSNGSVRLDGAEISAWDRENLGQYVGYVPQDVELFQGSVKENIARFNDIDPQKILEAAQISGAHQMILKLPFGYDTPLGEAGRGLSGGQKQMLALARAMYNKPVFVVLDEPNSNLDSAGEESLLVAINNMKKSKITLIVISHNIRIVSTMDKIMVLQQGTMEAFGPREQILRPNTNADNKPKPPPSKPSIQISPNA